MLTKMNFFVNRFWSTQAIIILALGERKEILKGRALFLLISCHPIVQTVEDDLRFLANITKTGNKECRITEDYVP